MLSVVYLPGNAVPRKSGVNTGQVMRSLFKVAATDTDTRDYVGKGKQ